MGVLRFKPLAHFEGLPTPRYETPGAAGFDLQAALDEDLVLAPGARAAIPTGLIFEIEPGFEVQVRSRSGMALRFGLMCLNSPGTVDADYRGEVKVILANLGDDAATISHGMRIAQGVLAPVEQAVFEMVEEVSETERGSNGFGSTGTG